MSPVWNMPESVFVILIWSAIVLMTLGIVFLVGVLVHEIRNGQVW